MSKFKSIFSKGIKNIRFIIAFCIIIFSIFSMVLISLLFANKSLSVLKSNATINTIQIIDQVSHSLDVYMQDMTDVSDAIINSMDSEEYSGIGSISDFLQAAYSLKHDITNIAIFDAAGRSVAIVPNETRMKPNANVFEQDWYTESIKNQDRYIFSLPHVQSLFSDQYNWVVTLSRYVEDKRNNPYIIGIDMTFNTIRDYCSKTTIGKRGYIFILDEHNNIIYHPQQQMIYAGIKDEDLSFIADKADGAYVHNNENNVIVISSLPKTNWKVVGVSYMDDFQSTISDMFRFIVLVFIIIFAFVLLFSSFISNLISKPILRLTKVMQKVEKGDLEIRSDEKSYNEVASLSVSFNSMIERINVLMERIKQEETELRKTELKALQAQINPHFLYNTLDSIMWMCERNRGKDATEMVSALSSLFRISISKGNEVITIRDEIIHAESYLTIQSIRYKNQFEYMINADESLMDYKCLKIILQPIIENAIYHGIDRMVDKGLIVINIMPFEDKVLMQVIDNGLGMPEEIMAGILSSEKDTFGIGLKNVNSRIQIYFGQEYGIKIQSEADIGTCIDILIPKLEDDYIER